MTILKFTCFVLDFCPKLIAVHAALPDNMPSDTTTISCNHIEAEKISYLERAECFLTKLIDCTEGVFSKVKLVLLNTLGVGTTA